MERVAFLIESTGERIPCLLNPATLAVRRWAGIRARRSLGGLLRTSAFADDPVLFTGGGTTELELELLFDVELLDRSRESSGEASPPEDKDVRDLTQPLWRLAENARADGDEMRPEIVRFIWGKAWNVPAVVASVAERFEAFGPGGAPGRSWMRLKLLRVNDPAPVQQSIETSGSTEEEPVEVHEIIGGGAGADPDAPQGAGGERLDEIAQRYIGDPSAWREIAEANGIDDPFHIPSGTALRIPGSKP